MNWRRFFRREEADAEQREELDFYLDVTTEEYIERGMEPAEARAAARRKLGNTTQIREEVYRMNTLTFMEGLLRDARHAVRMIRTKPGFSVAVLLSLALGIGANTAIFSVLNAVLIRPLPYPGSDALVGVYNRLVIQGQVFEDADLSARHVRCLQGERKGLRKFRRLDFRRRHGDRDGRSRATGDRDRDAGSSAHTGRTGVYRPMVLKRRRHPRLPADRDPQLRILAAEVRRRSRGAGPHDGDRFRSTPSDRSDATELSIR